MKTPQSNEGTQSRRETHAGSLRERLEINIRMIEKAVWLKEKISLLKFLSICRMSVYMVINIPDENLLSSTNKMSKKVMVSAALSRYGVTRRFL